MYGHLLVYAETFAFTLVWVELLEWLRRKGRFASLAGGALRDLLPYGAFLLVLPFVIPGRKDLLFGLSAAFVLVGLGGLAGVAAGLRSRHLPLLELGAALIIARSGILIRFFSSPLGGYLYLDKAAVPLTCLWLFAFTQFMKLANRLSGLFTGLVALFSYLVIGALLSQRTFQAGAATLSVALAGATTCLWLAALRGRPGRLSRPAASLWALTAAVASVIGTSKRVAFVALLTPGLLVVAPPIFFTLIISISYIGPKVRRGATRSVLQWNLTNERIVNVVMIFCLLGNLILLSHLFVEQSLWTLGLVAVALTVFLQTARFILLRGRYEAVPGDTAPADRVELLGVDFLAGGMEAAAKEVGALLERRGRPAIVVTPDALALLRSLVDRDYRGVLAEADLIVPDGAGVVWAGDILHEKPVLERIPGIELVDVLLGLADERRLSVFLLGTTDEVLAAASAEILRRHPGLSLAGVRNGYFPEEEDEAVIDEIARSGADIVLVAMGVPKQELWMLRARERLSARLMIGCGGSLDVMAGFVERAPVWLQKLGLEFLWRVVREPKRVKRALLLPVFVFEVFRHKVRKASARAGRRCSEIPAGGGDSPAAGH